LFDGESERFWANGSLFFVA